MNLIRRFINWLSSTQRAIRPGYRFKFHAVRDPSHELVAQILWGSRVWEKTVADVRNQLAAFGHHERVEIELVATVRRVTKETE